MTLILTVNGSEVMWMLADCRLSLAGKPYRDDACKITTLETKDGVALLGYAGLGATASGTEPSDWTSAVLRGRNPLLEEALGVVSTAMNREFPRHMHASSLGGISTHKIVVSAWIDDSVRLFEMDCRPSTGRQKNSPPAPAINELKSGNTRRAPRVCLAGSGSVRLQEDKGWKEELFDCISMCDAGKLSAPDVADCLARICNSVSSVEDSVGPRCVVAWRFRQGGRYQHLGAGAHQYYSGTTRDNCSPMLPTVAQGFDVKSLINKIAPGMFRFLARKLDGVNDETQDKLDLDVDTSDLPDSPDENLR